MHVNYKGCIFEDENVDALNPSLFIIVELR